MPYRYMQVIVLIAGIGFPDHARLETQDVIIGMEGDFKPWNYISADGKIAGFEVDFANRICIRMQKLCRTKIIPFDGLIPALTAGKIDLIMSGMQATKEREATISFSEPYANTGQTFATLAGSRLQHLPGQADIVVLANDAQTIPPELEQLKPYLSGKVIGAQANSTGAVFLERYLSETVEVREYGSMDDLAGDLLAGRVDAIWSSVGFLTNLIGHEASNRLIMTGPKFQGGILGRGVAVGLRKTDQELLGAVNEAIMAAKQERVIEGLSRGWFGFDVTPKLTSSP